MRDARVGPGGYSPAANFNRDPRVGGPAYYGHPGYRGHRDYRYGDEQGDEGYGYGVAAGVGLGLLGGSYYYGGYDGGYYEPGYYDYPGYYRPAPYYYQRAPARYAIGRYCATPQKTCLLYHPSEMGLHCSCKAPGGGYFHGRVR